MPTYQHSLSDVIAALNAKISDLEGAKNAIEERINSSKAVSQNTAVLQDINKSLNSAQAARATLQDSCCISQNCNFVYYD